MQQLLYKYLVLNNRLNIPSLGSFSVSYAPAQYNPQDGSLLPKQPILHFKDGPPATADTRLLPFLAAELNISPSAAANELLNFSLQIMSELVENKRAHLRGIGMLTKDGLGKLHFVQETANRVIQPAMQTVPPANMARSTNSAPPVSAESYYQPKVAPSPVTPGNASYTSENKYPAPTKKNLPEGKLDPTLDYASIQSYQESPDMLRVRQQLAQRREQVNAEFRDLREAKERMNRVHLPGNEGTLPPTNRTLSQGSSPDPLSGNFSATSPVDPFAERLNRSKNPMLRDRADSIFGKKDYPSISESLGAGANTSTDYSQNTSSSKFYPPKKESNPEETIRWNSPKPGNNPPSTVHPTPEPFELNDPLTVQMPKRSWQSSERPFNSRNTDFEPNQSNPLPTIGKMGRIGVNGRIDETKSSVTTRQAIPEAEQVGTQKWPWQKNKNLPSVSFPKPAKITKEDEEEKPQKLGFFAKLKSSITGLFKKKQVVASEIQEQQPGLEGKKLTGIFSKASAKLVDIKNNELNASGEIKKDYWWVYSIGLAFVATIAIIIHMI